MVHVSQCERVVLMHEEYVVEDVDVVVRPGLWLQETLATGNAEPDQVGRCVVRCARSRVPEFVIES
jgi:hypothetical protein